MKIITHDFRLPRILSKNPLRTIWLSFLFMFLFVQSTTAQIYCQEQSMWCWAACIQSSLFQADVYDTQSNIVSRLEGWPRNRPANNSEVIAVLQSYDFRAWEVRRPASFQELAATLYEGWKVIAFVNPSRNPQIGHYIMLQGLTPEGLVVISDPSPFNGCQTYVQSVQDLYRQWNWSASIVVGTPQ